MGQMDNAEIYTRLSNIQTEVSQAYQNVLSLSSRVTAVSATAVGAEAETKALMKPNEVTQKLLKDLITEIKDLREEGEVQQKQIEQLRKEMDEYRDSIDTKVNQLYQDMSELLSRNPYMNVNKTFTGWDVTCNTDYGTITSHVDENWNAIDHTALVGTVHDNTEEETSEQQMTEQERHDNGDDES